MDSPHLNSSALQPDRSHRSSAEPPDQSVPHNTDKVRTASAENKANSPHNSKVPRLKDLHPTPPGVEVLKKALSSDDLDFLEGIFTQLTVLAHRNGDVDQHQLDFLLSIVKGVKQTNQVETLLAAQMAAVYDATMTLARHLSTAENLEEANSFGNLFSKLARTFAAQVEALQRLRSSTEQKVTVQNVSVSDGSQAIVGNVTHTHGKTEAPTSPLAITDASGAAMEILKSTQQPAPAAVPRRRRA
jgi:hypothetical protein